MTIISRTDTKAHVQYNDKHYVVSDNGRETLIFPSDEEGNIIDWSEVGTGSTLSEVLEDFDNSLWFF